MLCSLHSCSDHTYHTAVFVTTTQWRPFLVKYGSSFLQSLHWIPSRTAVNLLLPSLTCAIDYSCLHAAPCHSSPCLIYFLRSFSKLSRWFWILTLHYNILPILYCSLICIFIVSSVSCNINMTSEQNRPRKNSCRTKLFQAWQKVTNSFFLTFFN